MENVDGRPIDDDWVMSLRAWCVGNVKLHRFTYLQPTTIISLYRQRALDFEHLYLLSLGEMPERPTSENLINNIVESLNGLQRQASGSSFGNENISQSVTSGFNRLFGRQEPLHHIFGGGKSADVLLWRNKKISASILGGATAIWVLFEWLNYHFLTILCFFLVLGMLVQFGWSNASGFMTRSPSQVPRIELPDQLFVNLAVSIGAEINNALGFLQDVACSGNLKQFLLITVSLWVAAVIGSWCNFLTVIYIGFVAAHTLPVLYEKNEDQVDCFVDNLLGQMQHHYKKIDTGALRRMSTRRFLARKRD
ncbi:hypothetical protein V2J09_005929 [Rumex salicifolius]